MSSGCRSAGPKRPVLENQMNRSQLLDRLSSESFSRKTVSFYRYTSIEDPQSFRDELFRKFSELHILGRVYVAKEGVNAQVSYPEYFKYEFEETVSQLFPRISFKNALEEADSFIKLIVKVKRKIVADGLDDASFDPSDTGKHLDAEAFNLAMNEPGTVVVDVRNSYESEIGHFEGALRPKAVSFREELPMIRTMLEGKENDKILLYCTGGIRCEKASAWLKHEGFRDVNQLNGGIIQYAKEVKEKGIASKFKGKNFVFDGRMAESVTDDVLASCHQCGEPADTHTNCLWDPCHLLFIQCKKCAEAYAGCCSYECKEKQVLPVHSRISLRRAESVSSTGLFRSRRIPSLPMNK